MEKNAYQHPWKLSRKEMLIPILEKTQFLNCADIGGNDMFYTKKMREMTNGNVYAVDITFPEEGEIRDNITCLNNIEKLPENELDTIVMMDVLEHIKDDELFFNNIVKKLKPEGTLLITVPAAQFLFSEHDVIAMHHRRYNRKRLIKLLNHKDIKVKKCHYFYTSLFLIQLLLKFLKKDKIKVNRTEKWKYSEKSVITKILKTILNIDFYINKILDKFYIHLPGLSLLAVCKKRGKKEL